MHYRPRGSRCAAPIATRRDQPLPTLHVLLSATASLPFQSLPVLPVRSFDNMDTFFPPPKSANRACEFLKQIIH